MNIKVTRELDARSTNRQLKEIDRLKKQHAKDSKHSSNTRPDEASNMKGFTKPEEKQRLEEENHELRKQADHRGQIIANREKTIDDLRQKLNVIVYQRLVYSNINRSE